MFGDGQADPCHARRVGAREVVAVLQGYLRDHFQLPSQVKQEGAVANLEHLYAVYGLDGGDDSVGVVGVGGVEGHVHQKVVRP